ncbi:MAG: carbohydrate kinase [Hydrogenophilaceae bacterium]|nr:carbohydrate kinase [Hydrogenophilaceae bacterium]
MQPILIVGNAVLDIILGVDHHPQEDEEMRAVSRRTGLGGNAANTARVLAGLGHPVSLLAALAPDSDAAELRRLLSEAGVDTRHLITATDGHTPVSYILLHAANGSRTIVHHRELGELAFEDFTALSLHDYGWIHFEGRNVATVARMIGHLRDSRFAGGISVELEKDRPGIDALLTQAVLVLCSRALADARGFSDAASLLRAMQGLAPHADLSCTWGAAGAWALGRDGALHHCPAFVPDKVVDTVGAGDVFNAGMIAALAGGADLPAALSAATALAGRKVGQMGLAGLS